VGTLFGIRKILLHGYLPGFISNTLIPHS
jgi:hypothetical protein